MQRQDIQITIALALSAASGLIYEIAATDVLFFYFVESSYSLATVLSVFLFGLGVGSFLIYRFIANVPNRQLLFAFLQGGIALYALLVLTNLTDIIPTISPLGTFAVSFLLLLLPTIFLGAIFPLAGSLLGNSNKESIGLVYSIDLVGAIAGSLLAGFYLIPLWGITFTVAVAALGNVASALFVIPYEKKVFLIGLCMVIVAGGVFSYVVSRSSDTDVAFEKPSPYGPIKVKDSFLYIDERPQCSFTFPDDASERMMANYALDPVAGVHDETQVLNIGLGCGLTADRVLSYPATNLDIVEINPTVVEANRMFSDILRRPRVQLIVDEGLAYLRSNKKQYHSILIDIEDPTVAYSSNLYTVEAFTIVSNALLPDGTFSLWNYEQVSANSYHGSRYFDILYYSLKEAFPHVYAYPGVFLATKKPLPDKAEYVPRGPREVNTIDKNILIQASLEETDTPTR